MENYKYRAFISYSHKDEKWGKWLHRKLESFRIPSQLIGKQAKHGSIPKRLFPVFRDRDELPSSSRLGEAIREALEQSLHLIVICSPDAAKSEWVNQEIKDFKTMGRERRILYFIVSGEPYAADRPGTNGEECFPEAAKYSVGTDGFYTNARAEPIAADAREVGDGQRNAFLKIVAGMLGVGLDDLKRRALQQRHRKLGLIAAASTMAALATIALAAYAFIQQNAAEEARTEAEQSHRDAEDELSKARTVTKFVTSLFASVEPENARGMDTKLIRAMLDQGVARLEDLENEPEIEARLRLTLGGSYRSIGAYDQAEEQLSKALPILQASEEADDLRTVDAMNELALVHQAKGNHKQVEKLLEEVLKTRLFLVGEKHPDTLRAQMDLATLYRSQGIFERAEELCGQALETLKQTQGEDDPVTIRAMNDLASVYFAQGKLAQAKSRFRSALELSRIHLGSEHPETLRTAARLVRTHKELKEFDDAEELWTNTAEKMKRVFGEDHPETLGGTDALAEIVAARGDGPRALDLYFEILAVKEESLGLDHPATFKTMEAIARLHFDAPRLVEAELAYMEIYDRMGTKLGHEHPATLRIMNALADCYVAQQKNEAAFSLRERIVETEARVLGPEDPLTLRTLMGLGELHYLAGRKDKAMEVFTKTLEAQERVLGLDHPDVARTSELRNRILAEQAAALEAAANPPKDPQSTTPDDKEAIITDKENKSLETVDRVLKDLRSSEGSEKKNGFSPQPEPNDQVDP
ncbi:MAG: toll/interleukin-1 receptor domain-containing protein [Opitutales bacterium]|jgi:tetratricopeptide (TPR) repeat protein